jgi:hypothetical protein
VAEVVDDYKPKMYKTEDPEVDNQVDNSPNPFNWTQDGLLPQLTRHDLFVCVLVLSHDEDVGIIKLLQIFKDFLWHIGREELGDVED